MSVPEVPLSACAVRLPEVLTTISPKIRFAVWALVVVPIRVLAVLSAVILAVAQNVVVDNWPSKVAFTEVVVPEYCTPNCAPPAVELEPLRSIENTQVPAVSAIDMPVILVSVVEVIAAPEDSAAYPRKSSTVIFFGAPVSSTAGTTSVPAASV